MCATRKTAKRKRRWYTFRGTKRQAQIECARLISELQTGAAVEPSRITVAQFLDRWLEHIKPQVAPRTHERYGEIVRTYLAPTLGTTCLTKLQPMAISSAYAGCSQAAVGKAPAGFHLGPCVIAIEYCRKPLGRPCGGECYLAIPAMTLTRRMSSGPP